MVEQMTRNVNLSTVSSIHPVSLEKMFFQIHEFDVCENHGSHKVFEAQFRHPILPEEFLGDLRGLWLGKQLKDERSVRFEMLSQELFRLFLPHQPKTIYGRGQHVIPIEDESVSNASLQHFVLSQKIRDFKPLPLGNQLGFFNGQYKHLGHVMALAIFLHEIDLGLGNIGIDSENRVVKIDGDWTMAEVSHPRYFTDLDTRIDTRLLLDVFYFDAYPVYNWFDIIEKNKILEEGSQIFPKNINDSPSFKNEFYEMIMMIALLPDEYYYKMVRMCLPSSECSYTFQFLQSRKEALLDAAFQIDNFVEYVLRTFTSADMVLNEFIEYIGHFKIQKDELLLPESERSTFLAMFNANRRQLLQTATRTLSSPKGIEHSFSSSSMFGSQYQLRIKGLPLNETSRALTKLLEAQTLDDTDSIDAESDELLIADQSLTF